MGVLFPPALGFGPADRLQGPSLRLVRFEGFPSSVFLARGSVCQTRGAREAPDPGVERSRGLSGRGVPAPIREARWA